jgi:hypothetical protein
LGGVLLRSNLAYQIAAGARKSSSTPDKPELGIDAERAAADARKIGAAVGEPNADGW